MEQLKCSEVAKACKGTYNIDTEICDVVIDTRKVTKGCLFICIKGERFDGHDFAAKAVEAGAAAVLASKSLGIDAPTIIVSDTSKALLDIAGYYRSKFNIPLVGLTGSVGKTTTKEFTYLVVQSKYKAIKTLGNLNNEIGLPQMLFHIDSSVEAAVIEMGMNHFGEIHRLTTAAKPTVALITNIGVSHIENLGSREGILKSKLEILDGLQEGAPLIINSDNDMLSTVKNVGHPIITFGINSGDYRAINIKEQEDKTTFTICYNGESQDIVLPTIGVHNVYNALAAFAVGMSLDIAPSDAAKALSNYVPAGMRQKCVDVAGITSIEDCYNASPDSMRASLTTLKNIKGNKKIAVLADMLELGSYSETAHRQVGQMVSELDIDYLLAYGQESRYYVEEVNKNKNVSAYHFDDKEELANKLCEIASAGDAVVFKGSRGMKLEEVINTVYDRWENK